MVAAVWAVRGVGWCECELAGLVGCGSSQEWFGGWWVELVGRFYQCCVWDGWLGASGSRCCWMVVDGVVVVGFG